jgi:phytoene/squalene synthetase
MTGGAPPGGAAAMDELAAALARGDPDRHLALLAAPRAARPRLLPLYALNLEAARAPWVSAEPMVGALRLQWWRDRIAELGAGCAPPGPPLLSALAPLVPDPVPAALLDALVAARAADLSAEGPGDAAALFAHLDATGGSLMWAAALALGAPASAEGVVRDYARAAALAAWFLAVPAYAARGRRALPDPSPAAVSALAREGMAALARARRARSRLPAAARPALLPGWQAGPLLARAARDPAAVAEGRLALPEATRRGRLLVQALTGRW